MKVNTFQEIIMKANIFQKIMMKKWQFFDDKFMRWFSKKTWISASYIENQKGLQKYRWTIINRHDDFQQKIDIFSLWFLDSYIDK